MATPERVRDAQRQSGPLDNLKIVNQLSQEAIGPTEPNVSSHSTTNDLSETDSTSAGDLSQGSLELQDITGCRPVARKDLQEYLFLAEERRRDREKDQSKLWSEQIRQELGLDRVLASDEPASTKAGSALVQPREILKQLALRDINLSDWQEVTATANIADLLRAARSLKAIRAGLHKDATEEQIAEKQLDNKADQELQLELSRIDLVRRASEKMDWLRSNAEANTTALRKDGSVDLGSFSLKLSPLHTRHAPPAFDAAAAASVDIILVPVSLVTGACVAAICLLDVTNSLESASVWAYLICQPLALVGGLLAGGVLPFMIGSYEHRKELLERPLARRKIRSQVNSSPAMQKVIKDLETMGIKCKTSLSKAGDCLDVQLYIPKKR